ncbi:MAG: hypothetical protein AAFY65_05160 [Pseudomonadota bacterium]
MEQMFEGLATQSIELSKQMLARVLQDEQLASLCAANMRKMYEAFVDVGFSGEEAIVLLGSMGNCGLPISGG